MANIVMVTGDTADSHYGQAKTFIEGLGHTVTGVAQNSITATNLSGYDLIILARHNTGASGFVSTDQTQTDLLNYWKNGKPFLVGFDTEGYTQDGFISSKMRLATSHEKSAFTSATTVKNIVVADNSVGGATNGYTVGQEVVYNSSTGSSYSRWLLGAVGKQLGYYPADTTRTYLLEVDKGTLDVDGLGTPAKAMFIGMLGTSGITYSTDSSTLTSQAIDWLLKTANVNISRSLNSKKGNRFISSSIKSKRY